MSKEANNTVGNKKKLIVALAIAALAIITLVILGSIYYYYNNTQEQKKIDTVFEQLKEQGIVFKGWKQKSNQSYSLIDPKFKITDNMQIDVGSFNVSFKDNGLLDFDIKNIGFKNQIVTLNFPAVTVSDYKLNKNIFDERLKGKMPSFFLHLINNDFKTMMLDDIGITAAFTINDIVFNMQYILKKVQLLDYYNGNVSKKIFNDMSLVLNVDTRDKDSSIPLINQTMSVKFAETSDINLHLQSLLFYVADDKPDQPFQQISGANLIKNYKVESKSTNADDKVSSVDSKKSSKVEVSANINPVHTLLEEVKTEGISMRYGKKAPIDIISEILAFVQPVQVQEKNQIDILKLLGLVRDSLYIVDMIGPYKQVIKNYKVSQPVDDVVVSYSVGEFNLDYSALKVSFGIKDIAFLVAKNMEELSAKKYLAEGKLANVLLDGIDFSNTYKKINLELDKLSKNDKLLDDDSYMIGLTTDAMKFYPRVDRLIVEKLDVAGPFSEKNISFDEISLVNKYAVDGFLPTSFDFNIVNYQQSILQLKPTLEALGEADNLYKFSLRAQADWDAEQKQVLFSNSFFESNVTGRLDLSVMLGQVQPYFFSGNMIEMLAAASGMTVKNLKATINDNGVFQKYVKSVALESNSTEQDVRDFLLDNWKLISETLIVNDDTRTNIDAAIVKFINMGGTLIVDAQSKTNFGVMLFNFANLQIDNSLELLLKLFNITIEVK